MYRAIELGIGILCMVAYLYDRQEERRERLQQSQNDITQTALAAAQVMKEQSEYWRGLYQELADNVTVEFEEDDSDEGGEEATQISLN